MSEKVAPGRTRVAIITARGGSKRIPRKNIRPFCGRPAISYAIEAALQSSLFDEVMVSTDDSEIEQVARDFGASVPFLRSERNSDDFASTLSVIQEVLLAYRDRGRTFEEYCCIYPTALFLTGATLRHAHERMLQAGARAVIPVCRFSYPIQRSLRINGGRLSFTNPEFAEKRSQDLEPRYHDAGQFYMGRTDDALALKNLFDADVLGYELDELRVQDIDTETDWKLAEIKFELLRQAGIAS